ncbi:MAG: polysaccharide biosynthesis tyrosine autokinase [Opitutales bacterium]
MDLEENSNYGDYSPKSKKNKTVSEFLLILRDRWLLAVTLALPFSLAYVYKELQVPEMYQSSSSFVLIPPPKILNLQKVDRDQQVNGLISKHLDGLNSQELRMNVIARINENSDYKTELLAPYLSDGTPMKIQNIVTYNVSVSSPSEGRPRFKVNSQSRTGKGAMIIADLVQKEYDKLNSIKKTEQVQTAKGILELLLDKSLMEEDRILKEISDIKESNDIPFIEDEKKVNSSKKSQFQAKITASKLDQIQINSILRQILDIRKRISSNKESSKDSTNTGVDVESNIAQIKQYFEIDVIESFGSIPSLRQKLLEHELQRKTYVETGTGYGPNHPKMIENARQVQEVQELLGKEVTLAIEDLRDRHIQLDAQEREFMGAMDKVQSESRRLGHIEEAISKAERTLAVVRSSTDIIRKRLDDVRIEAALPSEQDDPLQKDQLAFIPGSPYSPDYNKIKQQGVLIFVGIFLVIPIALEVIDNRIKSPWDIETFVGEDLLTGIQKISEIDELRRPKIVGDDLDDSLTESFRSMYGKIQMNSHVTGSKSILVTSAIPSEGKSLISANFAHTCANHGSKTILIDFDLRRPGLHNFCDESNDEGVMTILNTPNATEEEVTDKLKKVLCSIHPNLFLLPSGGKTRAATEIIEKKEFELLLTCLKKLADVVIFDSPPAGLFPDSIALARKTDEVLFVTRYGKVSRHVVKRLIGDLKATGANILGVILNDLPSKKATGYYYSGYYGYGYYRYKYYSKYYSPTEDT